MEIRMDGQIPPLPRAPPSGLPEPHCWLALIVPVRHESVGLHITMILDLQAG